MHAYDAQLDALTMSLWTQCVFRTRDSFRLNAVGQLSMVNDCSHPKLSLNGVFLAGPLYTSKLSLQAYSSRVTAFARVEVALPTQCSQCAVWLKPDFGAIASDIVQVTNLFPKLAQEPGEREIGGQPHS